MKLREKNIRLRLSEFEVYKIDEYGDGWGQGNGNGYGCEHFPYRDGTLGNGGGEGGGEGAGLYGNGHGHGEGSFIIEEDEVGDDEE